MLASQRNNLPLIRRSCLFGIPLRSTLHLSNRKSTPRRTINVRLALPNYGRRSWHHCRWHFSHFDNCENRNVFIMWLGSTRPCQRRSSIVDEQKTHATWHIQVARIRPHATSIVTALYISPKYFLSSTASAGGSWWSPGAAQDTQHFFN